MKRIARWVLVVRKLAEMRGIIVLDTTEIMLQPDEDDDRRPRRRLKMLALCESDSLDHSWSDRSELAISYCSPVTLT